MTKTDEKGFYSITAPAPPNANALFDGKKDGLSTHRENFPGFAAPDGDKNIELLGIIPRTR